MKLPLVLLSLLSPLSLLAQEIVPGAQASVNFQLTATYSEVKSSTEPTETTLGVEVTKQVTERLQSKDLLVDLIEQGVIEDTVQNAKNWRLVVVNRQPLLSNEGSVDLHFYAVRNVSKTLPAITPVLIPQNILSIEFTGYGAGSGTTKYDFENIVSDTGKFTEQLQIVYRNPMLEEVYIIRGIGKGSFSSGPVKLGEETFSYLKIAAVTISPIVGEFENTEDSDDTAILTGSISFSSFKAVDISGYPSPEIID